MEIGILIIAILIYAMIRIAREQDEAAPGCGLTLGVIGVAIIFLVVTGMLTYEEQKTGQPPRVDPVPSIFSQEIGPWWDEQVQSLNQP